MVNHVEHPRNVYLAERELLGPLDQWLATSFAPHRLADTVDALFAAQAQVPVDAGLQAAERVIADCNQKLARYRAALDAGADPALVTQWIAEVEASRAQEQRTSRRETRE